MKSDQEKARDFYKRMSDEIKTNDNRKFKNLNKEFYNGIAWGIKFAKMHYKFIHGFEDDKK